MAKYFRKKILLAKIETTYGTDPTPSGAANAILTSDLTIQLMQGQTVQRNTDREVLGNELTYHVAPYTMLSFGVELAGSGDAGTAPAFGPLLQACGFAETLTASTDAVYVPVSSGFKSLTLYYHQDGLLHKVTGAMGTVTFSLSPGGIPKMNFTFTGLRNAPTDTALPTPTLTEFQTPIPVTDSATPTFSLHSYSATMGGFNINLANEVVYRNVVGNEAVHIVDRAPSGDVSIEETALATKNFHTICAAHTTGALQMVHGTVAGNIVTLDAPVVQLLQPTYADSNGILMLNMNLALIPDAGNDELTLTFT
ncbi:MAG: hypothetical protein QG599_2174 [Pseudomonadota bacterium]|nr:hypothetical protein [Pseudomonadota bacterium]